MATFFRKCLFFILLASLVPTVFSAAKPCGKDCYKDNPYALQCPAACYSDWEDFKVDNACVDFCLDYRHTLSECQQSCSN